MRVAFAFSFYETFWYFYFIFSSNWYKLNFRAVEEILPSCQLFIKIFNCFIKILFVFIIDRTLTKNRLNISSYFIIFHSFENLICHLWNQWKTFYFIQLLPLHFMDIFYFVESYLIKQKLWFEFAAAKFIQKIFILFKNSDRFKHLSNTNHSWVFLQVVLFLKIDALGQDSFAPLRRSFNPMIYIPKFLAQLLKSNHLIMIL